MQEAWWALTKLGLDKIKADPEAYFQWTADTLGYPVQVVKDTTVLIDPDSPVADSDVAGLQETQDFLVDQKLAKAPFDLAAWVVR